MPLLTKLLARLDPSDIPRDLLQYVDIDELAIRETFTGDMDSEQGNKPLSSSKEAVGGAGTLVTEKEPLSKILELINERFDYDFDEDDRVFIEQLEKHVQDSDAVRKSIEVNNESDARLTFDSVATDELQEMVDKKFELYKKIVNNEAFGKILYLSKLHTSTQQPAVQYWLQVQSKVRIVFYPRCPSFYCGDRIYGSPD